MKTQLLSLTLIASISPEKCLEPCVVFLMDALLPCDANQPVPRLSAVCLFANSWSELEAGLVKTPNDNFLFLGRSEKAKPGLIKTRTLLHVSPQFQREMSTEWC